MKLKLGKITKKELGEWFGKDRTTLNRKWDHYLQELHFYAKFHIEIKGNGERVIIDEIIEPEYKGKMGGPAQIRNIELVKETWNQKTGIDTCMNVANQIYPIMQKETGIAESTNYKYTTNSRIYLWGKPGSKNDGILGSCSYIWCKMDTSGNLAPLNDKEAAIKVKVCKKYYGDLEDNILGIIDDI